MSDSTSHSILVVGGGQGIGLEVTKAVLKFSPSAKLVVFGLHFDNELESYVKENSVRIWTVRGDVRSSEDRVKAVETCMSEMKGIDTLVYTAGVITPIERIEKLKIEDVKATFDINVFGCMATVCLRF